MALSPCGANAALDEAKAGIDSLKDKLSAGLDSLTDVGTLTATIKNKLAEVNAKQVPSVSLQEELLNLPNLTPEEYTKKVAQLKSQFGGSVDNLDKIIDKMPKPAGMNAEGGKDMFADLQNFLGNVGAAFQNVQTLLTQTSIENILTDICGEVPNVQGQVVLDEAGNPQKDENGNVIILPPEEKPEAPVSPSSNPKKEEKPTPPPAGGFTFKFTKEKLKLATTTKASEWFDAMTTVLPKYGITTPERVAVFLGQISAEAGADLTMLKESSKYKAPSYFSICQKRLGLKSVDECNQYLASAEKTFQGLYEANIDGTFHYMGYSLHGKSTIQKGDGAKFCGRGLKQLTGRANYTRASKEIYGDDRLVKDPEQVATDKAVALETACWFWKSRNLNALADKFDIPGVTKLVNGGDLGLKTRTQVAEKAYAIFKG